MRPPRWCATVAALAACALAGRGVARADDKQACIDATEEAQQLRIDGKLTAARQRLLACVRPECPLIVRQDCSQWLSEVVAALPTVVLGARDAQGRDLFDVKVSLDGAPLVERLDGRPLVVDPGRHVFRFERAAAAVELPVLVRAGEQNRELTVSLGAPVGVPPPVAPVPPPPVGESRAPSTGPSPLVWVLGGAAVAALGTSVGFLVAQDVEYNHLASLCGGHCTPDQVSPVSTERTVAAWTAVGGGVSLAAAAGLFFLARPAQPAGGTGAPLSIDVAPGPRGILGSVTGRF